MNKLEDKDNLNPSGCGIGLSVWKMLSNLLGGNITVKSIYGKGSKFSFTFKANYNS